MRRIIERTVTVVTTTIWKFYWHEDTSSPHPGMDDFPKPESSPETVQHTEQFPTVIEAKEVDPWITKPLSKPTIDETSEDPIFYQSKKGNEKS